MKFSYNWLLEMLPGLDVKPAVLANRITLKTAECEGIEEHRGDYIIDIDNKSITHRPDLWGHHGMARELAAIFGNKLSDPVKGRNFAERPCIGVEIEDYSLCPRYSALVFEGVTVQPSPAWLQARLESIGLNAINNIVDVTNFVMAEIAQPMHAFDAEKLHGGTIYVRRARQGESIAALNDLTYHLDTSNLVIADGAGAIAIAGIIGGSGSAISGSTTQIVLESANFNASSVRKTSSRLKLRTDASMRFEKAQDQVNTIRGLERALELLQQVSPGIKLVGGVADAYRPSPPSSPILLPLDWLNRKLGRDIPPNEVRAILESLEFKVEEIDSRTFSVFVPSWRATKDIAIKDDLVEEVGRMVGYDSITPAAPLVPASVPHPNPEREFQHYVREMAAAQGFTEVKNYSFISEEMARAFSLDPERHVQVANPIAADQNLLRRSLLPGIWKNIRDNARHLDSFRLFEIGKEIEPAVETPHFAAAIFAKNDGVAGLLELKRVAECLLPGMRARPSAEPRAYEHPRRCADLMCGDTVLGRVFEFHPRMVEGGRAAVVDLDLALLEKLQPAQPHYEPLRKFPDSAFDLSIVAPARALIGDVERALARHAGPDLLSLSFLRDFTLPDDQRSLSYRLTVGAPDRTLTSDEVSAIRSRVIEAMRASGYELRV
ncbi:MAG: phenylalanine--tRNA ligase subunit beta [Bryobacterales bacterium]|nr:phenylalanine--tRNA ligase subunit beta [Bryobacterales bacterium]MBV9397383.1 phenylalanine--tRNA ligase subunit beta [Bryobacterales bacterium]